jgi:hypothetical protein
MTILAQLSLILGTVDAWAQPRGYKAEVVGNVSNLVSRFAEAAPQGLRVAILYTGFDKAGDFEEARMLPVTHKYLVVASAGKGFVEPSDILHDTAGHKPIFTPFEELIGALRAMRFNAATTDQAPDLRNAGVFTFPDGRAADAYQVELSIGTRMSAPDLNIPDDED